MINNQNVAENPFCTGLLKSRDFGKFHQRMTGSGSMQAPNHRFDTKHSKRNFMKQCFESRVLLWFYSCHNPNVGWVIKVLHIAGQGNQITTNVPSPNIHPPLSYVCSSVWLGFELEAFVTRWRSCIYVIFLIIYCILCL